METKRQSISSSSSSSSSSSELLSILNDDQLVEVFLRLPHRRSLIQCSTVCKRWYSLISNPQFTHQFIQFHHQKRYSNSYSSSSYSLPFTILFIFSLNRYDRMGEILSKKSKIIHGKQPSWSSPSSSLGLYRNIWPPNAIIIASFDDLLLISDSRYQYGICNPLTRQLFWLPDVPLPRVFPEKRGFVCELKNNFKKEFHSINDQFRFKVLICKEGGSANGNDYNKDGLIFCSETGKWSNLILSFPRKLDMDILDDFVASNRILCALERGWKWLVTGVVAIDLSMDGTNEVEPKQCRLIDLPKEFGRGWRSHRDNVWYGVVRGQLRLAQMVKIKREYDLKIWELELDCDSWVLVHTIRLKREKKTYKYLAAFHPYNENVIFISHNHELYKFEIEEENYKKVGELRDSYYRDRLFQAFTLVYPSWPTPIPISPNV